MLRVVKLPGEYHVVHDVIADDRLQYVARDCSQSHGPAIRIYFEGKKCGRTKRTWGVPYKSVVVKIKNGIEGHGLSMSEPMS